MNSPAAHTGTAHAGTAAAAAWFPTPDAGSAASEPPSLTEGLTYEQAMDAADALIAEIGGGHVSVDDLPARAARAMLILAECETRLRAAETAVTDAATSSRPAASD